MSGETFIDFERLKGRTPVTIKGRESQEFYIVLTGMLDELRKIKGEDAEAVIDGAVWTKMIMDRNIVMEMQVNIEDKESLSKGYIGKFRGIRLLCIGYVGHKMRMEKLGDEDLKPYEIVTLDYNR